MTASSVGFIAIGRPTFDVAAGRRYARMALGRLRDAVDGCVGTDTVFTEPAEVSAVVGEWPDRLDAVVVAHATFSDSSLVAAVREQVTAQLVLWAFPERRTGDRLRLNSLCGLNLAAYLLGRLDPLGPAPARLFVDPSSPGATERLAVALARPTRVRPAISAPPDPAAPDPAALLRADALRARLARARIGVIGEPPVGFEPCAVEPAVVASNIGTTIRTVALEDLFVRAEAATGSQVGELVERVSRRMAGVDRLDPEGVRRSLRLHVALTDLAADNGWDGVAPRCWPECFTDNGGACCTPLALAIGDGLAGACEADALGAVITLALGDLAGGDAFVADLVDVAHEGDGETAVLWHCGAAPLSMAATERPAAGVHVNREIPLVGDFGLRPGRVTIARFSRSRGTTRLVVGAGTVVDGPAPFRGTSGVVRMDPGGRGLLDIVVDEGLEHHYGFVYGDVTDELEALAALLALPLVRL
ncbi:MAG: hypothetical protein RIE08_17395 [Acidimicrobiales bacterium]